MKKGGYKTLAGFTFVIAAVLHLSRFVTGAELSYGDFLIPLWFSVLVGIWALYLMWLSFK